MLTREEVERVLREGLDRARVLYESTRCEFRDAISDIPALPTPDGHLQITKTGRANSAARDAFLQAIHEFNDFVLDGKVPQRLKSPGNQRPKF